MKIVIAGATGFIGKRLSELLIRSGHELIILTRSIRRTASLSARVRHVEWHPEDETSVVPEVDGSDAVINFAGEPVARGRWTKKKKERILTSRVHATQILVRSIARANERPKALLNASAVGFYGPRGSEELTEDAGAGHGILANICKAWEAHAIRAEDFGVRVVRLRIGIVLGKGGALQMMLPPFRFGFGGWLAGGNQWMSWIHLDDVARLFQHCLHDEKIRGAVNAVAPQAVTNKVFSLVLAQVLKRPCVLPVPAFALRLLLGGEMSKELLLSGQRAIPKKALASGFVFRFPELRGALEDILR